MVLQAFGPFPPGLLQGCKILGSSCIHLVSPPSLWSLPSRSSAGMQNFGLLLHPSRVTSKPLVPSLQVFCRDAKFWAPLASISCHQGPSPLQDNAGRPLCPPPPLPECHLFNFKRGKALLRHAFLGWVAEKTKCPCPCGLVQTEHRGQSGSGHKSLSRSRRGNIVGLYETGNFLPSPVLEMLFLLCEK